MSLFCKVLAIAALVAAGSFALAAPPTVVPSPGYDARLQEQRAANSRVTPPPAPLPATRRHPKKTHHH
jgi:hypothetical protein